MRAGERPSHTRRTEAWIADGQQDRALPSSVRPRAIDGHARLLAGPGDEVEMALHPNRRETRPIGIAFALGRCG